MIDSNLIANALLAGTLELLLVVLSADGIILFVNSSIEAQFGYAPGELVGSPADRFIHTDDLEPIRHKVEELLSAGKAQATFEPIRARTKNGEWRWVQANMVSRLAEGQLHGVMLHLRDVTSEVERERSHRQVHLAETEQRLFAQALGEAAALLNRVGDYEYVLDGILDAVARIVPYRTASIFMREGDQLRVVRARGFEAYGLEKWVQTVTFPADHFKFRMLVETGEPVVIADTRTYREWVALEPVHWIRGHVSAPIRVGTETVGMLGVDSALVGFYTAEHGARLTAFADLAAAALHNARLLQEADQRAEQLSLLYDVGLTLNRVLDERTQLDFLFRIARRALRADRMAFFRYIVSSAALEYEQGVGVPAEHEASLRAQRILVSEHTALVGWVAHYRVPVRVANVDEDPRWLRAESPVKSVMAVPVEHEQELRGILLASSLQRDAFTGQDERLLILFGNQIAAAMQLTRLFQDQARRQRELEILREASLKFTATLERARLILLILEYALRLIAADDAHLFLYENDQLVLGGKLWMQPDTQGQGWAPRETGVTYTVARSGKKVVVEDARTDPMFVNTTWGGAIVGLPLYSGGQVRGVLNVAYQAPHPFEAEELRVLELLADQAAVALENAKNYGETQRQLRDALLLHRVGEALSRTLAFQELMEQLADFFVEAVGVGACCISTYAQHELRVVADRDPIAETRVEPGSTYRLSDFPYLQRAIQERRTQSYRRDTPNLEPAIAENMDRYHWRSILVLPLSVGARVIGLVELADQTTDRDFSPDIVRLAESLAHQAASAVQNALLYEETLRRAEQLALLNRIARGVSGARTVDELLDVIEREALPLLPSDSYFIALYDAASGEMDFRRFMDHGAPRAPFRWSLGPSLTRQVMAQGHVLRLDERAEFELEDDLPRLEGSEPLNHSWLGAPMRSGGRIVGVISLQCMRPRAYGQAEEQLLQTIADQVAVAVERALAVEAL